MIGSYDPISKAQSMQNQKITPTDQLYSSLETAFNHFNGRLFKHKLPPVIFTAQRQLGVMGHFSANRWVSRHGVKCHEISINLSYVGKASVIELFQTLVHEQVHQWQYCFGKPGRRGYHNAEWAKKMQAVGLMPTDTGEPGGRKTGEKIGDYPMPGGRFVTACSELVTEKQFQLPWVDRFAEPTHSVEVEELALYVDALSDFEDTVLERLTVTMDQVFGEELFVSPIAAKNKVKSKYHCYECEYSLWGKSGLNLACLDCGDTLHEIGEY